MNCRFLKWVFSQICHCRLVSQSCAFLLRCLRLSCVHQNCAKDLHTWPILTQEFLSRWLQKGQKVEWSVPQHFSPSTSRSLAVIFESEDCHPGRWSRCAASQRLSTRGIQRVAGSGCQWNVDRIFHVPGWVYPRRAGLHCRGFLRSFGHPLKVVSETDLQLKLDCSVLENYLRFTSA